MTNTNEIEKIRDGKLISDSTIRSLVAKTQEMESKVRQTRAYQEHTVISISDDTGTYTIFMRNSTPAFRVIHYSGRFPGEFDHDEYFSDIVQAAIAVNEIYQYGDTLPPVPDWVGGTC